MATKASSVYSSLFWLALCSCNEWHGWDDVPTAFVTVSVEEATAEFTDEWSVKVEQDVEVWNSALSKRGCQEPFEISDVGHPVTLVAFDTWPADNNVRGMTRLEDIRVRQGSWPGRMIDHPAILLHELGHALGLEHANPAYGFSVMTPSPFYNGLQPRDIDAAACVLGCGPCSSPDKYDGD